MDILEILNDIHRTVGRIDGQMQIFSKVPDRVAQLELWQSWQKGAWAVLLVVLAYLFKHVIVK